MDNMYPYLEYIKVFAAYMALLYLWPNVVFRTYLKEKGLMFRFLFCCTAQIVLINGVVLSLALFGILKIGAVRLFFWGVPVISVILPIILQHKGDGLHAENTEMGRCDRGFLLTGVLEKTTDKRKRFWRKYKGRMPEYLMLAIILLFGMAYFSIGMLQHYTYGHYDLYIHFPWLLEMRKGTIFPEGIYPEAMHCFIYSMSCLSGVSLYSCMLFVSGIHILTFLLAAYCLLKELFQHSYTPLFVLTAWLTYDAGIEGTALENMYIAMARLSWTLPQEFGVYLVFLCPLFLLLFFRKDQKEALFFLMLGVGAAVSIHFYVLIIAFFLCLAAVIAFVRKMFSGQRVLSLIYAVGKGINLGAFPMIAAYLMGMYPHGSIGWGINRINGVHEETTGSFAADAFVMKRESTVIKDFYEKGCVAIFGETGAAILLLILLSVLLFLGGYCLVWRNREKGKRWLSEGREERYLFIVIASVALVFLYASPAMGLPEFVAIERLLSILKMVVFAAAGVVIDLFLSLMALRRNGKQMRTGVFLGCASIYCFAYLTDFHEYLYSLEKHYKAAVFVTDEITKKYGKYSHKIISMDDEKGQVEKERREELSVFLQNLRGEEYYLPAEYLFLYVEKRPVVQGQTHYYRGPFWLADRSSLFHEKDRSKSLCPDICHTEISWEMAQKELPDYPEIAWYYWNEEERTLVSSKAYYWYQDFARENPQETAVFYEDDDFVCYVIHQNPEQPLNLVLDRETVEKESACEETG